MVNTNNRYLELILLCGSIALITALHYSTPMHREPVHEVLRRLYYLPIVYAAARMGRRKGLLVAGATVVAYLPHMAIYLKVHNWQSVNNYADMLLLLALGGGIGYVRDKHRYLDRLAVLGGTTARIVHDMKNPIASIQMASQLLREELPEEQRAEFSDIISESVQRFLNMTAELLEFSRGGAPALNLTPWPVKSFLEETAEALRPEFERGGKLLMTEMGEVGEAEWDWERIRRVVANIARNALEVLPPGGSLRMDCSTENGTVLLRFTDNGPGMPPQISKHVFDAFFTSGKAGGTGLGLAISKEIITQHGGSMEVKSEEGKGTTFFVSLPRTPPPSARAKTTSGTTREGKGGR